MPLGKKVKEPIVNFFKLAPFFYYLHVYSKTYVLRLRYTGEESMQNFEFKLLMYVFNTYVRKLQGIFRQDLGQLMTRTNNAREGCNAILAKAFSIRPTERDIANFVTVRFKKDIVKSWEKSEPLTPSDEFFSIIPTRSRRNVQMIITLCSKFGSISQKNMPKLFALLKVQTFFDPKSTSEAKDDAAETELKDHLC